MAIVPNAHLWKQLPLTSLELPSNKHTQVKDSGLKEQSLILESSGNFGRSPTLYVWLECPHYSNPGLSRCAGAQTFLLHGTG